MRKFLTATFAFLMLISCSKKNEPKANLDIIPLPQKMEISKENGIEKQGLQINSKTKIVLLSPDNQFNAEYLQEHLKKTFNGNFQIINEVAKNAVILEIVDENKAKEIGLSLDNEAYIMTSSPENVKISALTAAGTFYGIQTLMQMLPATIYAQNPEKVESMTLPAMEIIDNPRFKYRGMMLDCSRTFFDAEYIKRFIDALSYYKINNFHWHLTDDQGWRVEIKKYPKLTELGAWRGENEILMPAYGSGMERNGGFYSQDQVREIVKYAADRQINIIPEIELPGHSKAVAVCYPEIGCEIKSKNLSVQGESNNVWCVGREENYAMLDDIITEMAELFPGKMFHIGADEVNMDSWMECPHCQALMKEKGMKEAVELQNYFVRRVEKILDNHGKTMAGWDEILDGGELLPNTTPYAWRNLERGMKSVKAGHPTVMQVGQYMYFDMKQSLGERGLTWAGIIPIEMTYSFDPIGSFDLTEEETKLVLGPQGGLWAECLQAPGHVDYQLFPKVCALSEIGWTNYDLRDINSFKNRVFNGQYERLYEMGFSFRIAPPAVNFDDGKLIATAEWDSLTIRYTTDKSTPTLNSEIYTEAITTQNPENYRFATFYKDRNSIARGAQNIDLYHYMKPKTTVESNVPMNQDINRLVDYDLHSYCYTSRPIEKGDYVKFTFEEPVKCNKITMATGHYTLAIVGVPNGFIEYSYNGEDFIKGEDFKYDYFDGYMASCYPEQAVKAVRINVTGIGECEYAIIQDLRIE